MCAGMIGLSCLVFVSGLSQANAASPQPVPLRLQLDPSKPMHVHGANALSALVPVWHQVPADIRPVSVLELDNYDNSARAVRFEKCIKVCQENGIPVVPEVVREGEMNETISFAWLDGILKKYPNVVGTVFNCNAPDQLKPRMMWECLEVCGQNGAYFLYNMNCKGITLPEHLDKMLADPDLVAAMKKYHRNIVVNYYTGGFGEPLTEAQKAENLKKLKKMLADGLIARIGYFYREMSAIDVDRERANGCTAFGAMESRVKNDYWKVLWDTSATEPAPLRWKIEQNRPIHVQGCTVLRDMLSSWLKIPADIRPISVLELDNYDNTAQTECFEDCFIECQKNGIPVMPEVVRYGRKNETINASWLDGVLKKYSTIVAIVFDCNAPDQLDTSMMREYLEVCGQNGVYFFFNMENKAITHPEDIDKILADHDLLATMKKYHKSIVVSYYGGGMRGVPTDAEKAENLKKLTKMLAEGLIGRIGYYHCQIRGSDVGRESASGCTVFGGNEFQEARNADYWESLRNVAGFK